MRETNQAKYTTRLNESSIKAPTSTVSRFSLSPHFLSILIWTMFSRILMRCFLLLIFTKHRLRRVASLAAGSGSFLRDLTTRAVAACLACALDIPERATAQANRLVHAAIKFSWLLFISNHFKREANHFLSFFLSIVG